MKQFLLVLLIVGCISVFVPQASAQDDGTIIITPSLTPTPAVSYELPYPGLLPDNPLYILKTARDQVIGFLISDASKKAEFDLLQADKRFQGGVMLYQKDSSKKELAFTTISKSHNYLERAIEAVTILQKQNDDISDLDLRITMSIRKQQEVLRELKKSRSDATSEVDNSLSVLDTLQKKASKFVLPTKDKK